MRLSLVSCKYFAALGLSGAALIGSGTSATAQDAKPNVPPELAARMAAEKDARRACKIDICKAIAAPSQGAPITCSVTKTWLKEEILNRVVGGSYVWGYGHMQCSLSLNLDRAELGKMTTEAAAKLSFPQHKLNCNVEDADPAKGTAFSVNVALTPVVTTEKGEAKSVELQPVKTEGSTLASAAVTSLIAVDKVSGLVSRAAAGEINTFIYDKCGADGVAIVRK